MKVHEVPRLPCDKPDKCFEEQGLFAYDCRDPEHAYQARRGCDGYPRKYGGKSRAEYGGGK